MGFYVDLCVRVGGRLCRVEKKRESKMKGIRARVNWLKENKEEYCENDGGEKVLIWFVFFVIGRLCHLLLCTETIGMGL